MPSASATAVIMAGVPLANAAVYHRIRFAVVDQVVYLEVPDQARGTRRVLILRDIEMERARQHARVDEVHSPADFKPEGGLSGDRETATAQAAAECLRRAGVRRAVADRTLPLIYADMLRQAGIDVHCDREMGIVDRRRKDEEEIAHLREAQRVTEEVMARACRLIAQATARADGVLWHEGQPLTAERVRAMIDHWLIDLGYANPPAIVAAGPQGADCHELGSGELRTGQPVILDIFPRNRATLYHGDCTRTVVHGEVPDPVALMHAAVCRAKKAAIAAVRAEVSGEAVHAAATEAIRAAGYAVGLPKEDDPPSYTAMVHGTGHGVGLEVHEPPLLDLQGPPLVAGDVVTIEPGLYRRDLGGVRVEDMVVVTAAGCENLNRLPEGLDWR
ncbi:MAG: Xaa-Pro peptidase family protein [Thermoguttaceae bacterium]|jgi:Xaa-Pro aminopeptidase|nr:Xaa-Pro peptidase family protein [Thermoguttaceae bacterium]